MWNVQLFKLNFDEQELKAISEVIEDRWLAMGQRVQSFEYEFQSFIGHDTYCKAVSSCTAALHLSLLSLNLGPEDEVIIPSLTFISAVNVVKQVGAKPVIADCKSLEHWNVSVQSIETLVNSKTKAIMVVHYAGVPCSDIQKIKDLCDNRNIRLIEDVAHAPGASIYGKHCGAWGDIGCFSFYSNKNLSVGEGGMTTTTNQELDNKIALLRAHGMNSLMLDRHKGRSFSYDISTSGLNYRMDEIRAAIGLIQLKKLKTGNEMRKIIFEHYKSLLEDTEYFVPFSNEPYESNFSYHIMPILIPEKYDKMRLVSFLKSKGIQTSMHYPPFWSFSAFKSEFNSSMAPITKVICDRQLTLPLYPTMKIEEVELVVKALKDFNTK